MNEWRDYLRARHRLAIVLTYISFLTYALVCVSQSEFPRQRLANFVLNLCGLIETGRRKWRLKN